MSKTTHDLGEIHLQSLEGLGASYRLQGYFELNSQEVGTAPSKSRKKVLFTGIVFGGNYGGHNVNVEISADSRSELLSTFKGSNWTDETIESLLSEVQRRILSGEMIVEFEKLKREEDEKNNPFGSI